jgi:radical SAM/Cys-rich protein
MNAETVDDVIACVKRIRFATVDITGGAPELFPHLPRLIAGLEFETDKLIVRTNLVALTRPGMEHLPELYRRHGVSIVASLPATNESQTEAQRGHGTWDKSISMLKLLNGLGYGKEGSGLTLDLVSNPVGDFLAPKQCEAELKYRRELMSRFDITFNNLLALTNVPLGRFRSWLEQSGNLEDYIEKLEGSFNPSTVSGLMCRTFISVDWNGFLYDCDFNLTTGKPHGGRKIHVTELCELPRPGTSIPVGDYCFACTAGAGSSCGGSISA